MASFDLLLDDATRVPLSGAVTIGRSPPCSVVLHDLTVSRRHARIRVADDGEPVLEDAGSSFGTFLDGARITGPTRLHQAGRARLHDEAKASHRGRPQRADRAQPGPSEQ